MDTINVGLQNERGQVQDISIVDTTSWNSQTEEIVNNSTLLYIAVSYVPFQIDTGVYNLTKHYF